MTSEKLSQALAEIEREIAAKRERAAELTAAAERADAEADSAAEQQARLLASGDDDDGAEAAREDAARRVARNNRAAATLVSGDLAEATARADRIRQELEAARESERRAAVASALSDFSRALTVATTKLATVLNPEERAKVGKDLAAIFGRLGSVGVARVLEGRDWSAESVGAALLALPDAFRPSVAPVAAPVVDAGPSVGVGILRRLEVLGLPPDGSGLVLHPGAVVNLPSRVARFLVRCDAAVALPIGGPDDVGAELSEAALRHHRSADNQAAWRHRLAPAAPILVVPRERWAA